MKPITCIQESSFEFQGITHVSVEETNRSGNRVCSGCKLELDFNKAYSLSSSINKTTIKHYSVHKRCTVKEGLVWK